MQQVSCRRINEIRNNLDAEKRPGNAGFNIGDWDPEKATGNPAKSVAVKRYQFANVERGTSESRGDAKVGSITDEGGYCQTVSYRG